MLLIFFDIQNKKVFYFAVSVVLFFSKFLCHRFWHCPFPSTHAEVLLTWALVLHFMISEQAISLSISRGASESRNKN